MVEDIACITEDGKRYTVLEAISYFLFAVGPLVGNAVLALLGAISIDFAVNPTAVLVAIPAFMFPFAIIQLFSGAISDVYGRVRVIVFGLVIFIVGLALTGLSISITMFALGNFVSGVGFGFSNPVLLALLSDCAIPEDIPKRMGIASALASFSVGFGPFIAGQMALLGWQLYYLLFLVIVTIGMISISLVKRPPRRVHEGAGVRTLASNLNLELRRPAVLLMMIASFMVSLAYLGTFIWTSRGLTGAIDDTLIGILLLGGGIAGTVAGGILGRIVSRYGYGLPMVLGLFPLLIGVSLFIFIGDITLTSSLMFVSLGIIIVGWAGGLLLPIMITVSQVLSPERRGVLAGLVSFAFFMGSALIPTVYEPLFHMSMNMVYIGILVVSLILILLLGALYQKVKNV
ncbi:MAG: MFS transporter [Candidatus Thorarchaeota archaeon]